MVDNVLVDNVPLKLAIKIIKCLTSKRWGPFS